MFACSFSAECAFLNNNFRVDSLSEDSSADSVKIIDNSRLDKKKKKKKHKHKSDR